MAFKTWVAGDQLLAADLNENFSKVPSTTAVASGALSSGDKVVLNSDGTISVIAGASYSAGSVTTVSSGNDVRQVLYDAASGNIVVYHSPNGEHYVTVGSISGTTITFGSRTNVPTGGWVTSGAMCRVGIGSNKIIIASVNYDAASHPGQIVVGTISGTTISFGSSVGFAAGIDTNAGFWGMDWDTINSKAVLCYQSGGTSLVAAVVTVSGTVPTVNSSTQIAAVATAGGYNGQVVWTGTSNKFLISYADTTNSQGKVAVLTVSGTSVSAGTIATFFAGSVLYVWNCWDATNSCMLIAYRKVSDTSGWVVPVTYSGTTCTVGTPYNFATGTISPMGIVYESNTTKSYVAYYDGTNAKAAYLTIAAGAVTNATTTTIAAMDAIGYCTGYLTSLNNGKMVACFKSSNGKAIVFSAFYTNLTSTNFLGITQAAISNAATGRVSTAGCRVSSLSGMTAGLKYYLNDDGTLSTDNTKPYLGLALSATDLIIKG